MDTTSSIETRFPDTASSRNDPMHLLLRHTTSPSQRPVIEQLASGMEDELAIYEAEMDKLKVSPASLEHERNALKKNLSQYRSPVHRLPPEILGKIFTMFNDLPEEERWLEPTDTAPALAVSRTCRRWRDIALSLPSIWSSIAIAFKERWSNQESRLLDLTTRLFLDRSQTSPLILILSLDGLSRDLEDNNDAVMAILKTLVQHSERWYTVELRFIAQAEMAHSVFNPIAGHLPILTNLTLIGFGDESFNFRSDLFSDCPALTSITCELNSPLTISCPLPWGQIRSLQIENTEIAGMVTIVLLCPNVEQLAVRWCVGGAYTGDCLSIPGVKHLSIVAMVADEAYCAFKYLTLQRLSSLEISCAAGRGEEVIEDIMWKEWDEQHIVDFFGRSTGSSVTSLSLRYVPISGEQLLQLLWLMPALCYLRVEESSSDQLTITNRTITQPFLQRLTIDIQDSSPSFLPKLTNIGLVLREDGLVENMLPSALISRLIPDDLKFEVGVECIKSVEVILIAASKETVGVLKSKLQLLRDGGVWVTVARIVNEGS